MTHTNLTRAEAAERARLLSDVHYEVALDLTVGEHLFGCDTIVRFRCRQPGANTFLDLVASDVERVELNGRVLPPGVVDLPHGRIRLDGLGPANEARVVARCSYERTGVGLHRFVDPIDQRVYLHTQFEPFDAHRVYPCFDQPDLKATFALTVNAPEDWVVVSNGTAVGHDGRWRVSPTRRVPTYVTALVAGPYHEVRDHHDGIDLGLYCRQSLARYLDPDEVFEITKSGFDFFHRAFNYRYPFGKYDQLFVPEFSAGAMENAGCVTVSESYVFRSRVTDAERERRAETLLHELAHMWFGDLVTMRWWDDLWLNESFATFMGFLSTIEVTRFTGASSTFWKSWAYRQDQLPSTHPIVADIPDIDSVKVNFDGITYAKGAAVLRQLVAWVGEESFLTAMGAYFRRHEYGNTTLADFLRALEEASGRDLSSWSAVWLETAGVNTVRPSFSTEPAIGGEAFASFALEQTAPEAWPTLRPHRLAVGLYEMVDGRLARAERVELDVVGACTEVPELVGRRVPPLVLVNDGDLTYAKIRLDDRSLATLTEHLGSLDDVLTRALCWSAAWDMLRDAELPARRYLPIVLNHVASEPEVTVVQSLLGEASSAVLVFGDPANRPPARQQLAEATHRLLHASPPGSDHQLAFAAAFVGAARSERHLGALRGLLDGSISVEGLAIDTDFRWRIVRSLAAAGAASEALIIAELERDPTDAGRRHAAGARAALPTPEAKAETWAAVVGDRDLPLATMVAMMQRFQQPDQEELLAPYVEPYFEALAPLWRNRVPEVALAFTETLYPSTVASEEVVERTDRYLAAGEVPPPIRRLLVEGRDQVQRILRTRACDARAG